MLAFCETQNARFGKECYRVEGLEEPEIVPEILPESVAEEPAPEPVEQITPRIPVVTLKLLEYELALKTLGLHQSNAIARNRLKAEPGPEQAIAQGMVAKGAMGYDAAGFYLTVAGLCALENKKPLFFGVIG